MKPGLWMSIATVGRTSRVYRDHPEWLVVDRQGKPMNLHTYHDPIATACMTTGWYDHIKSAMLRYVKDNDLKYLKIDLSIATAPTVLTNRMPAVVRRIIRTKTARSRC